MIRSRQRTSSTGSWTSRYFLSDRLSVRMILDTSGNVMGRQAHLPFGEDFGETGIQAKHHFTSYERDGESGTDYAVNRQYSQTIGRYSRPDPFDASGRIGNPQTLNRYSYARNNPVNRIDRLGLEGDPLDGLLDDVVCVTDEEGHRECVVVKGKYRTGDEGAGVPQPGRPRPPVGRWSEEKCQMELVVTEALAKTLGFWAKDMVATVEAIGGELGAEAAEIGAELASLFSALSPANVLSAGKKAKRLGRRLGGLIEGLANLPLDVTLRDKAQQGVKDVEDELGRFADLFNHCSRTLKGDDLERLNRLQDTVSNSTFFYRAFYNGFLRATEPRPI